jgi:hypothetical protein
MDYKYQSDDFRQGLQPIQNISPSSGNFVTQEFTGNKVQNVFYDNQTHLKSIYDVKGGPFVNKLQCHNGLVNADGKCINGFNSSAPYEEQPMVFSSHYINSLYNTPNVLNLPHSKVASYLIQQRGPINFPHKPDQSFCKGNTCSLDKMKIKYK